MTQPDTKELIRKLLQAKVNTDKSLEALKKTAK